MTAPSPAHEPAPTAPAAPSAPPPQDRRVTADAPATFVVFLIGMRIRNLWAVRSWLRVARAMPRMLTQLFARRELGLRHVESFLGWRTILTVQYWESFEKLEAFARSRDLAHVPAWKEFHQHARGGDVGIFHETYVVREGTWEAVYVDMPPAGVVRAFGALPATGGRARAAGRLRRDGDRPAEVRDGEEGAPPAQAAR